MNTRIHTLRGSERRRAHLLSDSPTLGARQHGAHSGRLVFCHAETQFQVVTSFVDHPSAVHLSVLYAAVRLVAVSPAAVRQMVYRFSLWPVEMLRGPVLRDREQFVQALQPSRDRPVRTPPRRNGGPWMPFRDARQLSDVLL